MPYKAHGVSILHTEQTDRVTNLSPTENVWRYFLNSIQRIVDCSQNGCKVSNKSSSGSLSSWGVEAETSIQGNMPTLVCKHGYHLKASEQPVGVLVCKITWHRLQCPLVVGMLLHNTAMMSGRQDSSHCFIVRQKAWGNSHHCSPARGWGNSHHCSPLTRGWGNSHHYPPEGGATVTTAHQRVGQQSPLLTRGWGNSHHCSPEGGATVTTDHRSPEGGVTEQVKA